MVRQTNYPSRFEKQINVEEALEFRLDHGVDEIKCSDGINPMFEDLYLNLIREQERGGDSNLVRSLFGWTVIYSSLPQF